MVDEPPSPFMPKAVLQFSPNSHHLTGSGAHGLGVDSAALQAEVQGLRGALLSRDQRLVEMQRRLHHADAMEQQLVLLESRVADERLEWGQRLSEWQVTERQLRNKVAELEREMSGRNVAASGVGILGEAAIEREVVGLRQQLKEANRDKEQLRVTLMMEQRRTRVERDALEAKLAASASSTSKTSALADAGRNGAEAMLRMKMRELVEENTQLHKALKTMRSRMVWTSF